MNTLTLTVLGLGLSVDAFAAALGKGATAKETGFKHALKAGLWFGGFEALAPALGGLAGLALASWITSFDHWIAFILLLLVGGHMILESRKPDTAEADEESNRSALTPSRMILTAMATSIDSAAVGVSLSLLQVNLLQACLIIGFVCTAVTTTGVLLGRHAGKHLGKRAEAIGGIVLILIGTQILVEHTLLS